MANDVTVAEVGRRLDRLDIDMRERFKAVDDRFASAALMLVPRDVYEERHLALRGRVESMERLLAQHALYRRNLLIAIAAALVASVGAIVSSVLAVTIH